MFERTAAHTVVDLNTATDPFTARFGGGHKLPHGLRQEAAGMSWSLFTATYCPTPELKISSLESERLRGGKFRFSTELTLSSKTTSPQTFQHEVTASGAVCALSHLLAEHNRYVEVLTFRQHRLFEATVTFVEVAHQLNHHHRAWAVGFGPTPELSAGHALTSGAQRIHG